MARGDGQDGNAPGEAMSSACSTPQQRSKLGFADAVRERGDSWLHAMWSPDHGNPGEWSAATWLAMREAGGETHDALRMRLCETTEERLFQVERPIFRCGCNGLCDKHPDCPGVKYQPGFPYKRGTP